MSTTVGGLRGVGELEGLAAEDVDELLVHRLDDLLARGQALRQRLGADAQADAVEKRRATLSSTSASRSAVRISFSASSRSSSLIRPLPRRRVEMRSRRSDRASNMGSQVSGAAWSGAASARPRRGGGRLPSVAMVPRLSLRSGALVIAMVLAGALGLAACSSSPSNSASDTTTTAGGRGRPLDHRDGAPAGSPLNAIGPIPAADRSPAGTAGTQPTVTVPSGTPPTQLESADLITGTGQGGGERRPSRCSTCWRRTRRGKVIQSSWTSQPFTFTLGQGRSSRAGTRASSA